VVVVKSEIATLSTLHYVYLAGPTFGVEFIRYFSLLTAVHAAVHQAFPLSARHAA
jgi:hypothetical protein